MGQITKVIFIRYPLFLHKNRIDTEMDRGSFWEDGKRLQGAFSCQKQRTYSQNRQKIKKVKSLNGTSKEQQCMSLRDGYNVGFVGYF